MADRWAMRPAPELATEGEPPSEVFMVTCDGRDVIDSFGYGFTRNVVDDLNAKELTDPTPVAADDAPQPEADR